MKKIVSIICVLILSSSMIGAGAFYESDSKDILKMCSISNEGTEYWALLVGCNEFLNKPTLELPGNDISTEDLKNLLTERVENIKEKNIRFLGLLPSDDEISKMNLIGENLLLLPVDSKAYKTAKDLFASII